MKRLLLCLSMLLSFVTVQSQTSKVALSEGRRYMVAFPQVWASTSETPLPKPMQIFISSAYDTKVRVSTPAVNNSNTRIDAVYDVKKDKITKVSVPVAYMNSESERISGFGISVIGDAPITVYTYQAWNGNGELARHYPIGSWGKNYYSMNFYQDQYGLQGQKKLRPSQFVVIADKDNTVVSFTPMLIPTEGGADSPKTVASSTSTITLNRGETFLVKSEVDDIYSRDFTSDMSGTYIRANKPIAVVSGHTKVGIMRYPDVLPPTGAFAAEAHFVRNNVHDALFPVELAGTEFITIPVQYGPSRVTGVNLNEYGIDDDRGDVIRFNGLEDGTILYDVRADGTLRPLKTLRRGESFIITAQQVAAKFVTSKPALCGQYGKSFARIIPPMGVKGSDATQGHPTTESGMPMLEMVPSIDRWVNYGVFHSSEGMDNFMGVAFILEDAAKIKMDGQSLMSRYAGSIRQIAGTPYAYLRTPVSAGDHVLKSDTSSVRWMAWTYGSLDGLSQGRAYGTPVGANLALDCDDSVSIEDDTVCGDIQGFINVYAENDMCVGIFDVFLDDAVNFALWYDEDVNPSAMKMHVPFALTVLDRTQPAYCKFIVLTKTGRMIERVYVYEPNMIEMSASSINYGTISLNTSVCRTVVMRNVGTKDFAVVSIKPKNTSVFTVTPSAFTLLAGDSITLTVCANIPFAREYKDTLVFSYAVKITEGECYIAEPIEVVARAEEPNFYAWDKDFGSVPKSQTVSGQIILQNTGTTDVTVTGFSPSGDSHFTNLDLVTPITIKSGERISYNANYSPNGEVGVQHTLRVDYTVNSTRTKLYSILSGIGTDASLTVLPLSWIERVIDTYQSNRGINWYQNVSKIQNTGNVPLTITDIRIVGVDAQYFVLASNLMSRGGFIPDQMTANSPVYDVAVQFIPLEQVGSRNAERTYAATIEIEYTVNGETKIASAELNATAFQPRLDASGYDWGNVPVNSTNTSMVYIYNVDPILTAPLNNSKDATGIMEIYELRIPANTPFVWTANNSKVLTYQSPVVIGVGQSWAEQVTFNPTTGGSWSVPYEVDYNGSMTSAPLLIGQSKVTSELTVSDLYLIQWYANSVRGMISVMSNEDAVVTFSDIIGNDAINFTLVSPLSGVLQLKANEPQYVEVEFTPNFVTQNGLQGGQNLNGRLPFRGQSFQAYIDFTDIATNQTKQASIIGDGKYLETTVYMPTDYTVAVGQYVQVYTYLAPNPQQVDSGVITQFRTRISYDERSLFFTDDIIQVGTQTDGWEIINVVKLPNMIEIDFKDKRTTTTPLSQSAAPLYGLRFQALLSDKTTVDIPIQMYWIDAESVRLENREYTVFNVIPGRVSIDLTCAGFLRVVDLSSTGFFVNSSVTNDAIQINYGVGISGYTSIALVNTLGQTIQILSTYSPSGSYSIEIDEKLVSDGIYTVVFESSHYKATSTLVKY